MKSVRKLISAYVNENFHVSLMLVFYFELTNIYIGRKKNLAEYIFLFYLTFLAYNYLRKNKLQTNKQLNSFLTPIYFIGIVYTSIYFFYLDFLNKSLVVFLTCLTFFYKNQYISNKSLRSNPITKILTISLSWALLTCIFLNPNIPKISKFEIFHFFERLFLLISVCLVFEIKDYNEDSSFQMSLPNKYGIGVTRIVAGFFIYVTLFFLFQSFKHFSLYVISILTALLLTQILILIVKPKSDFYFTRFWTEAIPVVAFIILKINL